ncbi:MAG: biopolymer transporter ExbD [Verrucomicrobiota bacterium]|jgi:biopolymer transport protein ExbD
MKFITHKRPQTPTIIIVSLIDVLLVVLIFLMVTTTAKQQPSVRLALPESKQPNKTGATENALVVTIPKQGPIYLKSDPVTLDSLQEKLTEAVRANPHTTLAIRADTDAAFGQVLKVVQAASAAHIPVSGAFVKVAP